MSETVPDFGIMLKSYGPDLHYAQRFLESFIKYASEQIPLFVVVPDHDVQGFEEVFGNHAAVLPESLWADQLVDYPIHGNNPGYINQEIIKLAFAEKGFLKNYLCADSEAVFIRPFGTQDFMDESGVPYSFITEDNELHADPSYFEKYWKPRDRWLKDLRRFLQLETNSYLTCHGFAVLSSIRVIEMMDFLNEKNMSLADALQLCPYEFSWYNFWIEKFHDSERFTREPIFKTIHMEGQYLQMSLQSLSTENMSRGYVGLVVNSGFSRGSTHQDFGASVPDVLAHYVSYGNLLGALGERLFVRAPRVRRLFGPRHWAKEGSRERS